MKALCKQTMGFILMILLACGVTSIKAQDSADDEFITVSGVVKDKQTRKKLEYVNISIPGDVYKRQMSYEGIAISLSIKAQALGKKPNEARDKKIKK